MPVWTALIATLGLNYARHRTGRSTLCSSARAPFQVHKAEGRLAFVVGWTALSGWLIPHFCKGPFEHS
jgi:hypothetical protein